MLRKIARKGISYLLNHFRIIFIFSVTINTIATKSYSDVHSTRKLIDNHDNESLLSPDLTKKSRKNSRQNTSQTFEDTQIKPTHASSDASATNKLKNPISSTDDKYLSKETRFVLIITKRIEFNACSSNIQNAARPTSNTSRLNRTPSPVECKTSDTDDENLDEYQDIVPKRDPSWVDESLTQKLSNIQSVTRSIISQESRQSPSNISTKTGKSSISTLPTRNPSLSQDVSYIKYRITSQNPSTNKLSEVDHMSTVYEESEPSSNSISHRVASSLRKQSISYLFQSIQSLR